jgi:hypothetical protein
MEGYGLANSVLQELKSKSSNSPRVRRLNTLATMGLMSPKAKLLKPLRGGFHAFSSKHQ